MGRVLGLGPVMMRLAAPVSKPHPENESARMAAGQSRAILAL